MMMKSEKETKQNKLMIQTKLRPRYEDISYIKDRQIDRYMYKRKIYIYVYIQIDRYRLMKHLCKNL